MNTPNRKKKTAAAIWTLLSLAVIVLVIFSFFSIVARRREAPEKDPVKKTEETTASEKTDVTPIRKPVTETAETTAPEPVKEPDVTTSVTEKTGKTEDGTRPVSVGQLTFTLPIAGGTVQKGYSDTKAVYSLSMNDYRVHTGIDLYAPVGSPVLACADGIVESISQDPFLGCTILIDHGANLKSLYCNLSDAVPQGLMTGCAVVGGEVIGGVGETMKTETADSPHLHFEMQLDGKTVDPGQYLGAVASSAGTDDAASDS